MTDTPVTVTTSLTDLKQGTIPLSALEDAFGPSSLGILIVKDLPSRFEVLRMRLLSYASYLARLRQEELGNNTTDSSFLSQSHGYDLNASSDAITDAISHYEVGWSHGKEMLKTGQYDTHKGSFYVNCQAFYLPPSKAKSGGLHVHTAPNLWPSETLIPGFRETFEEFCTLVIDIGALVARACDQYAGKHVHGYEPGYLEQMVKTSSTTKARLLHYFPREGPSSSGSSPSSTNIPDGEAGDEDDSWCASHLDDGCLTALTSALYVDESSLPPLTSSLIPTIPTFPSSPDPKAGLYIRSRTASVVKVSIPSNCLAFQTGEALELLTNGAFKAVPHFVRGPSIESGAAAVTRNTLAIFMQPDIDEIIDKSNGLTFGEFANMAVQNHS